MSHKSPAAHVAPRSGVCQGCCAPPSPPCSVATGPCSHPGLPKASFTMFSRAPEVLAQASSLVATNARSALAKWVAVAGGLAAITLRWQLGKELLQTAAGKCRRARWCAVAACGCNKARSNCKWHRDCRDAGPWLVGMPPSVAAVLPAAASSATACEMCASAEAPGSIQGGRGPPSTTDWMVGISTWTCSCVSCGWSNLSSSQAWAGVAGAREAISAAPSAWIAAAMKSARSMFPTEWHPGRALIACSARSTSSAL